MASGMIGKLFFCDKYGNYDSVQCEGDVCYCADQDGNQVGNVALPIEEIEKLTETCKLVSVEIAIIYM